MMDANNNNIIPRLLSCDRINLVSPPPEEYDKDVAELLSNKDAMEYLKAFSKHSTGGWSVEDTAKRRLFQTNEQIEFKRGWFCVIINKESGAFMGIGGLRSIDWSCCSAEMGIILHPNYWRQGYCTEAHKYMLQCSFETLLLNRVTFVTLCRNTPMKRFLSHVLNATLEGTARDFFPNEYGNRDKGFEDGNTYSLLACDWPVLRSKLF
jgi:[ribosomal protein S5]-alanine N-acetyltransferase